MFLMLFELKFMCLFLNFLVGYSIFYSIFVQNFIVFNVLFSAVYTNNCFKLLEKRYNQLTLKQFNSLYFDWFNKNCSQMKMIYPP